MAKKQSKRRERSHTRTSRPNTLRAILAKTNGKCFWCGREVMSLKLLVRTAIAVTRDSTHQIWFRNEMGETLTVLKMTVDHVFPHGKGGTDNIDNLVPSCYKCNATRTDPKRRHEFERRDWMVKGWQIPEDSLAKAVDAEVAVRLKVSAPKGIHPAFAAVATKYNDVLPKMKPLMRRVAAQAQMANALKMEILNEFVPEGPSIEDDDRDYGDRDHLGESDICFGIMDFWGIDAQ